jgi:hypothetical protein
LCHIDGGGCWQEFLLHRVFASAQQEPSGSAPLYKGFSCPFASEIVDNVGGNGGTKISYLGNRRPLAWTLMMFSVRIQRSTIFARLAQR